MMIITETDTESAIEYLGIVNEKGNNLETASVGKSETVAPGSLDNGLISTSNRFT